MLGRGLRLWSEPTTAPCAHRRGRVPALTQKISTPRANPRPVHQGQHLRRGARLDNPSISRAKTWLFSSARQANDSKGHRRVLRCRQCSTWHVLATNNLAHMGLRAVPRQRWSVAHPKHEFEELCSRNPTNVSTSSMR